MAETGVGVVLLSKEEVRALLLERLDSREYWVFVPDLDGHDTMQRIESAYYDGEANADFDVYCLPLVGLSGIATAKKSRMSAGQLHALIKDELLTPLTVEDLEARDVLFLADHETVGDLIEGMLDLIGDKAGAVH